MRCQVGPDNGPETHEEKRDGPEARAASLKPVLNSCIFVGFKVLLSIRARLRAISSPTYPSIQT